MTMKIIKRRSESFRCMRMRCWRIIAAIKLTRTHLDFFPFIVNIWLVCRTPKMQTSRDYDGRREQKAQRQSSSWISWWKIMRGLWCAVWEGVTYVITGKIVKINYDWRANRQLNVELWSHLENKSSHEIEASSAASKNSPCHAKKIPPPRNKLCPMNFSSQARTK